jgi:phosphatidylserine/phosphatidylglycerophosphate/cardiolipin synthase-like enzyme
VKKQFLAAALVILSFSSLFAVELPVLETVRYRDLAAMRDTIQTPPVPDAPVYTPAPVFGQADTTGIPLYFFTETTRVSPALVRAVDGVLSTLDVALYNLQLTDAAQALVKARDRGVKVRVIIDYDHVFPAAGKEIKYLIDSGMDLRVMKGRGGSGSMHNKYAIFDGTALQMGSANWTSFAESSCYENMMFVYDAPIIRGYQENFEWMWNQGRSPSIAASPIPKAGPLPADPDPSVDFNGTMFPKYIFSPRGGTEAAIVKAVDAAGSSVDVAMFTLTSAPIMDALLRAASRGLKVRLTLHAGSKFPFYKQTVSKKIALKFLEGRMEKGLMHNKFAVLDDKMLINGSFNWSDTAEQLNTENVIFTVAPEYVAPYLREYDKLFQMARPAGSQRP